MKLYELKKWDMITWLSINDTPKDIVFDHMDWMYCYATAGEDIIHIAWYTELEKVSEGKYKTTM